MSDLAGMVTTLPSRHYCRASIIITRDIARHGVIIYYLRVVETRVPRGRGEVVLLILGEGVERAPPRHPVAEAPETAGELSVFKLHVY